jgi:hypothetical protein
MVLRALALAATVLFAGAGTAVAEPYTNQFRGDGGSSFGFAWDYARWDARDKAIADGFSTPASQCVEIFAFGNPYSAMVIWECTREV